jgi:tripartite-type tricarboxylate transporter receptor subunit TctC
MKQMTAVLLLVVLACVAPVNAQDKYPSKPIQMLVPTTSGSGADFVARLLAERLTQRLGQSVLVQNRQGAGGTIATQALAKSAPDGYTIMLTNAAHSINPWIYRTLPYDSVRDFAGVALVGETPMAVTVSTLSGIRSVKQLITLAKRQPGTINFGSAGVGSATHLAGEYFASRAGIKLIHVPYRTVSELYADLMSDRIQALFAPMSSSAATLRTGKALALALTSRTRVRATPDLPTVSDDAISGFEYTQWFGYIAPAAVPAPILDQLARAIRSVCDEKDVREKLEEQGIQSRIVILREFDAFIKADIDKLGQIVRAAGVKAN